MKIKGIKYQAWIICGIIFYFSQGVLGAQPLPSENLEIRPLAQSSGSENLVSLLSFNTEMSTDYVELLDVIKKIPDPGLLLPYIDRCNREIDTMAFQIETALSENDIGYPQMEAIKFKAHDIFYDLKKAHISILKTIRTLSDQNKTWTRISKELTAWEDLADRDPSLAFGLGEIENQKKKTVRALQLIFEQLTPFLTMEKQISTLKARLHAINLNMGYLAGQIQKKKVSIFSPQFFSGADKAVWLAAWKSLMDFGTLQMELVRVHGRTLVLLCLVIGFLSLVMAASKKKCKPSQDWYTFALKPVASSIFLLEASAAMADFFKEELIQYPQTWETLKNMIALAALIFVFQDLKRKSFTRL